MRFKDRDYAGMEPLLLNAIEKLNTNWDRSRLLLLLSRVYVEQGKVQEAVDILENLPPHLNAGKVEVHYTRALYTLGTLKHQLGDTTAARDYLNRYLAHWGNADWEVDEVNEAKALLAELGDEGL